MTRPTIEELEARVRTALIGPGGMKRTPGLAEWRAALAALTDLAARAKEAEALDAWASSMPDAGFSDADPRWEWWLRRPRIARDAFRSLGEKA